MNPCPAGLVCSELQCRCRPDQVRRYQSRISGPLLDRIDLHVPVPEVPKALLLGEASESDAGANVVQVSQAMDRQLRRQGKTNAGLTADELDTFAAIDQAGKRILSRATDRYRLSARGFHRVLRVARSIADLDGDARVSTGHLGEALGYRAMDWSGGMAP